MPKTDEIEYKDPSDSRNHATGDFQEIDFVTLGIGVAAWPKRDGKIGRKKFVHISLLGCSEGTYVQVP